MAGAWAFRVTVAGGQATVEVEPPGTPPDGVYQVSGAEGSEQDTHAHTVSVVRHDTDGRTVVGASGYGQ
jgi:hypothetical protein